MEYLSSLSQLVPAVAIAVVLTTGFILLIRFIVVKFMFAREKADTMAANMHKEKTIAFMKQSTEQRDAFLLEIKEGRIQYREDVASLRKTLDANTETTKNLLTLLKVRNGNH